jgi:membrane protein implicated in regulation of membrane protease activity
MDWSENTLWWILAGVLVAAEMTTGTFYLLMLALGAAAGALAAHAGAALPAQLIWAAAVGAGATALWHVIRGGRPTSAAASENPDVNLDIGQTLVVPAWLPDGTARVSYRGAEWSVRAAQSQSELRRAGLHRIVAMHGSELTLEFVSQPGPAL